MAIDISQFGSVFYGWMKTGMFWVIVTLLLTCSTALILWWRKRTRLKHNVLEIISFGNGKIGVNLTTAGLFLEKSTLGGLWDYGNEFRYKTKDGRTIYGATSSDLHDVFGKKSFIVRRKDDDPKILLPITEIDWKFKTICNCPKCNYKFRVQEDLEFPLFQIAPKEFRDASVDIIKEAHKETQGMLEKYLPYILLGGIVIFFIISMILASQFFSRTVDKSSELLLKAGQQVNANTGVPSTIAP